MLIIIMQIYRSFIFLLLLSLAFGVSIATDSYLELGKNGYTFAFKNPNNQVELDITGLPINLTLNNYTIKPTGDVIPGQYILSVKASDASSVKDEKIVILNVDSGITANSSQSASSQQVQNIQQLPPTQADPASSANSLSSSTVNTSLFENNISSISSFFQTNSDNSISQSQTDSTSLDSLRSYFNEINVGGGAAHESSGVSLGSNNINDILSDFSNSSTQTNYSMVINAATLNSQSIISKSSINLSFNESQKSTISTDQANALFLQQKLASQYVAGNYSIVLQLAANKDMLNSLITNITKTYQTDEEDMKSTSLQLNAASQNKSKIESAISNLKTYLFTLKTQINASSTKLNQLQTQRQTFLTQINKTQSNTLQATQSIQSISAQIASANTTLSSNTQNCSLLNSNLNQANKTLNVNTMQLGFISQQLDSAVVDINNKQATVDDLMRQLVLAQQALQLAQNNSKQLTAQKTQLQQVIASSNLNISSITQNLNSCNTQSTTLKQNIQSLQTSLTTKQTILSQYANQNSSSSNQLGNLQSQISQETANYNNLQNQTNSATSGLTLLQNALPNATLTLQKLSELRAQAAFNVQSDEANLNEAITRFKNESASLELAKMNLQNARALSQQADKKVNSMLAERGNALPYAVAVNSTNTALIGQTIVNPSINIANWFNYLTANFGSAAFPYQSSQISCLYQFNLTSNLRNSISCPSDGTPLQSFTGKISSVSSFNEIVVIVDGTNSKQTVEIPSCATLASNINGYKILVGDNVLVKAQTQGNNPSIAKSIVFLRQ